MRNVITSTMGACHELCVVAAIFMLVLLLSACGDDSSSVAPNNDEPSSSANSSSSAESSSSEKDKSSSSSAGKEKSSVTIISGADLKFSSSMESSSSSAGEVNCSALLEEERENGEWSWDVPKECRFNPDIDYGTMTDERDGKVYKTVKIGDQVWMAENLNYSDSITTPSLKGRSWCYDNELKNCDVSGRLYTWVAAIDSVKLATDADNPLNCGYEMTCKLPETVQGICPSGWHLPSKKEWNTLITAAGGETKAGKVLKSTTGWNDDGNGTDAYGFSAIPVGCKRHGEPFTRGEGVSGEFWSATESYTTDAYQLTLKSSYDDVSMYSYGKPGANSVRCLKN